MSKRKSQIAMIDEWSEMRHTLFSPEEIAEVDIKVALLGEIIKTRNEAGLSQRQLEEVSGIRQPVIARLESGKSDPQLSTVIKLLASIGKTLQIADLQRDSF
jgi:DNA-binding XRE family transcriptional regulator